MNDNRSNLLCSVFSRLRNLKHGTLHTTLSRLIHTREDVVKVLGPFEKGLFTTGKEDGQYYTIFRLNLASLNAPKTTTPWGFECDGERKSVNPISLVYSAFSFLETCSNDYAVCEVFVIKLRRMMTQAGLPREDVVMCDKFLSSTPVYTTTTTTTTTTTNIIMNTTTNTTTTTTVSMPTSTPPTSTPKSATGNNDNNKTVQFKQPVSASPATQRNNPQVQAVETKKRIVATVTSFYISVLKCTGKRDVAWYYTSLLTRSCIRNDLVYSTDAHFQAALKTTCNMFKIAPSMFCAIERLYYAASSAIRNECTRDVREAIDRSNKELERLVLNIENDPKGFGYITLCDVTYPGAAENDKWTWRLMMTEYVPVSRAKAELSVHEWYSFECADVDIYLNKMKTIYGSLDNVVAVRFEGITGMHTIRKALEIAYMWNRWLTSFEPCHFCRAPPVNQETIANGLQAAYMFVSCDLLQAIRSTLCSYVLERHHRLPGKIIAYPLLMRMLCVEPSTPHTSLVKNAGGIGNGPSNNPTTPSDRKERDANLLSRMSVYGCLKSFIGWFTNAKDLFSINKLLTPDDPLFPVYKSLPYLLSKWRTWMIDFELCEAVRKMEEHKPNLTKKNNKNASNLDETTDTTPTDNNAEECDDPTDSKSKKASGGISFKYVKKYPDGRIEALKDITIPEACKKACIKDGVYGPNWEYFEHSYFLPYGRCWLMDIYSEDGVEVASELCRMYSTKYLPLKGTGNSICGKRRDAVRISHPKINKKPRRGGYTPTHSPAHRMLPGEEDGTNSPVLPRSIMEKYLRQGCESPMFDWDEGEASISGRKGPQDCSLDYSTLSSSIMSVKYNVKNNKGSGSDSDSDSDSDRASNLDGESVVSKSPRSTTSEGIYYVSAANVLSGRASPVSMYHSVHSSEGTEIKYDAISVERRRMGELWKNAREESRREKDVSILDIVFNMLDARTPKGMLTTAFLYLQSILKNKVTTFQNNNVNVPPARKKASKNDGDDDDDDDDDDVEEAVMTDPIASDPTTVGGTMFKLFPELYYFVRSTIPSKSPISGYYENRYIALRPNEMDERIWPGISMEEKACKMSIAMYGFLCTTALHDSVSRALLRSMIPAKTTDKNRKAQYSLSVSRSAKKSGYLTKKKLEIAKVYSQYIRRIPIRVSSSSGSSHSSSSTNTPTFSEANASPVVGTTPSSSGNATVSSNNNNNNNNNSNNNGGNDRSSSPDIKVTDNSLNVDPAEYDKENFDIRVLSRLGYRSLIGGHTDHIVASTKNFFSRCEWLAFYAKSTTVTFFVPPWETDNKSKEISQHITYSVTPSGLSTTIPNNPLNTSSTQGALMTNETRGNATTMRVARISEATEKSKKVEEAKLTTRKYKARETKTGHLEGAFFEFDGPKMNNMTKNAGISMLAGLSNTDVALWMEETFFLPVDPTRETATNQAGLTGPKKNLNEQKKEEFLQNKNEYNSVETVPIPGTKGPSTKLEVKDEDVEKELSFLSEMRKARGKRLRGGFRSSEDSGADTDEGDDNEEEVEEGGCTDSDCECDSDDYSSYDDEWGSHEYESYDEGGRDSVYSSEEDEDDPRMTSEEFWRDHLPEDDNVIPDPNFAQRRSENGCGTEVVSCMRQSKSITEDVKQRERALMKHHNYDIKRLLSQVFLEYDYTPVRDDIISLVSSFYSPSMTKNNSPDMQFFHKAKRMAVQSIKEESKKAREAKLMTIPNHFTLDEFNKLVEMHGIVPYQTTITT